MTTQTNPRSNQQAAEAASGSKTKGQLSGPTKPPKTSEPSIDVLFDRLDVPDEDLNEVALGIFISANRQNPKGYRPGFKESSMVAGAIAIAKAWFVGLDAVENAPSVPDGLTIPGDDDDDDDKDGQLVDDDQLADMIKREDLEALTVPELKAIAGKSNVDLSGLGKKTEVIDAILNGNANQ